MLTLCKVNAADKKMTLSTLDEKKRASNFRQKNKLFQHLTKKTECYNKFLKIGSSKNYQKIGSSKT